MLALDILKLAVGVAAVIYAVRLARD